MAATRLDLRVRGLAPSGLRRMDPHSTVMVAWPPSLMVPSVSYASTGAVTFRVALSPRSSMLTLAAGPSMGLA